MLESSDYIRIAYLDKFGFTGWFYTETGLLIDTINRKQYNLPYGVYKRFHSKVLHKDIKLSGTRLTGYYFTAPWNGITVWPYKRLNFVGAKDYVVTWWGSIFSLKSWSYLVGNLSFDGYKRVLLSCNDGKNRTMIVSRLVAKAFIPNPQNKPEVNHKDGNKLNNCVYNLEWVYGNENVQHARENGLRKNTRSDETIHEICKRLEKGDGIKKIMTDLNLPKHAITDIKSGCHYRISKNYNIPRNKHFPSKLWDEQHKD